MSRVTSRLVPPSQPHAIPDQQVCHELGSSPAGLSRDEATRRLELFGPNELPEAVRATLISIILRQFKSWLVVLLIVAAVISALAGEIVDMWVIIAVIVINAAIGVFHELRADKAMNALKSMISHSAEVMRDGKVHMVQTSEIVPGDVLVLAEGNNIAADARILSSTNFRTDESALTGESVPSNKSPSTVDANAAIGDRNNMVWKGTFVVSGTASAIVVATGINTQIGNISRTLQGMQDQRSDFLIKTDVLARKMSFIAIGSAVILFLLGYFVQGLESREILLVAIAALVAAIPEGLPAVLAIVLAIGAHRMAKRNAIIRDFTATETLGAVTAILTDKTGTLTMNSLTVRKVFLPGQSMIDVSGEGWFPAGNLTQGSEIVEPDLNHALNRLLTIAAISNNA